MRCLYDAGEISAFIDTACAHRTIIRHITAVLCCHSIDVIKSCVFKQTDTAGLLGTHWDIPRAYNKCIIILGICATAADLWLDRRSRPTSGGVDVYNHLSGHAHDYPATIPVRYDPTHQGGVMSLRGNRYRSQDPPPPKWCGSGSLPAP